MKVIHVVPHISAEASGPSYSVPRLCQALAARGLDVELSCLEARRSVAGVSVDEHPQWPILGRFAPSSSHPRSLWRKAPQVDLVHNHSLWSMVNVTTGWVVPGRGPKLVTSPRGTLSGWSLQRRAVAKWMLWPAQRRVLTKADLLHATSEAEYEDIRRLGLRAPVLLAPNGIDVPDTPPAAPTDGERKTLLYLGRLHPTKGIDRLLKAWSVLEPEWRDWELSIVGIGSAPDEQDLKALAGDLGLRRARFVGPRYGVDKSDAYRNADLFVLPTHSENFGMVVAEALVHGCPVIVSKGAPWASIKEQGCGWWIDNDVESLRDTMNQAMTLTVSQRYAMGGRGRQWMLDAFSWQRIAADMEAAYDWLLDGGVVPANVRLD